MTFPSFFADIPTIVVHDRLAEFLGAADGGVIEYRYADAVKLAGHSCPTVAGAYLLARRALAALYPDTLPERGDIQVESPVRPGSAASRASPAGFPAAICSVSTIRISLAKSHSCAGTAASASS